MHDFAHRTFVQHASLADEVTRSNWVHVCWPEWLSVALHGGVKRGNIPASSVRGWGGEGGFLYLKQMSEFVNYMWWVPA